MLNTSGLALEQAPPLWVPLGFFLTAPLHLAAAGLLLTLGGASLWASRWTPGALAVVHLILLGFLSQVMFGALLQVFPVLAGAPVPGVTLVSRGLWGLLNLGVPLQCAGFLSGERGLLLGGSLLVVAAVVLLLGVAGGPLLRAKGSRPTLVAMGLSLFALVVTAALGLVLVLGLVGLVSIPDLVGWTNVHLSWGLFGWAGILLVGVSFQVLPLFYLSPEPPPAVRHWLAPGLFAALILTSLAVLLGAPSGLAGILLAVGFLVYLGTTYWSLRQRRRARSDVTLDFWHLGFLAILGAALGWPLGLPATALGVLLLVGVMVGIPTGMLYKIVPFLAWFHLQQAQIQTGRLAVRVPHTGLLLSPRWVRWQWALHLAAFGVLLVGPLAGDLGVRAGGALMVLAALLLVANLGRTSLKYQRVRAELAAPQPAGA